MKNIRNLFILIIFIVIGCSKKKENPTPSISKEDYLTGGNIKYWKMVEKKYNGISQAIDTCSDKTMFSKSKEGSFYPKESCKAAGHVKTDFAWYFTDNENKITITKIIANTPQTFEIIEINDNKLRFLFKGNDVTSEYTFIPY